MIKPVVLVHNDRFEELVDAVRQAHPDLSVEGCGTYVELGAAINQTEPDVVTQYALPGDQDFRGRSWSNRQL